MLKYIFRKIIYSLIVFLGVVTVIFFLFNILPGDSSRMMMGQRSDLQSLKAIRTELGLDQSFSNRYIKYLDDLSPISIYSKNSESYFYFDKKVYKQASSFLKSHIYNAHFSQKKRCCKFCRKHSLILFYLH